MDEATYTLELTRGEIESLRECLGHLRERIDREFQSGRPGTYPEPAAQPVFRSACEMQFKIAKVLDPETDVTLNDFLNYGDYGLRN